MKNMKYGITFGIALVCVMLFTACNNITDLPDTKTPIENGYGRISVNFTEKKTELQTARTVFPSRVFDQYVYTFTKIPEVTTRQVTIDMYDSGGDGWGGNGALRIVVNGTQIANNVRVQTTAANNNPSGQRYTNKYTFHIATGDVVQLYWVAGSSQNQNSFIVYYTDTPPNPVFADNDQGPNSWSGRGSLLHRVRTTTTSGTVNGTLQGTTNGALLGSFTGFAPLSTSDEEAAGMVKEPDNDGFFTLNVGRYTVEVQAYIGNAEPYTLVASGASLPFNVDTGINEPVAVGLNEIDTGEDGTFTYTITYPGECTADITLQKWSDMSNVTLNHNSLTEENGITETLELEAGYYQLTVMVSKDEFYAGISEVVHINSSLATVYTKNFLDSDLLATPPNIHDYNINGIGTFTYDGNARAVSVTPKDNASTGEVTVFYNGSETAPVNTGEYIVTFNLAATRGFNAAIGFPAGMLTINKAAGVTVSAPLVNETTHNSITINPVTAPSGQLVEYGINTSDTAPSEWQSELTFDDLDESTTYYIFACAIENNNYETGEASNSLIVTTLQTVSGDRFEYYWVDAHSSLVTTSGGTVTVAVGEILTITAQGTGYIVKHWYLNGGNTGQSGNTYNFSSMSVGRHTVSLFVEKDGKPYNTNITITVIPLISITAHPESRIVAAGSISGSLSVTADVTPNATLSYQWYSNTSNSSTGGTVISGATNANYTIPTNLAVGTYYYYCEVGSYGAVSVHSDVATVTVAASLTAGTWRNGNIFSSGGEEWFRFTATANTQYIHISFGTLNDLYVQLYDTNFNTVGTETNLYSNTRSTSRTLTNGQIYYIRVRPYSSSGSGTYLIAFNTSTTAPSLPTISINTHPTSRTVAAGNINSSLSVAATINPSGLTLGYQWYSNISNSNTGGSIVSGATSATFAIPTDLTAGTRYYFCEVRVGATTVRSNVATVTVVSTTTLTANTWTNGNIPTANGQQWFRFTATANTQYIHVTFGTLNDLYVQLYDSNFNTVGTESNLYGGTRSASRTLTNGQVYYIRVRPYYSNGSGGYQIAFNTSTTRPN